MHEPFVCPICWALQNPENGKCLVCGKAYTVFNGPPIVIDEFNPSRDYYIPVIFQGRTGHLIFRGRPYIVQENNGRKMFSSFTIEMESLDEDDPLFALTLVN